MSTEGAWCFRVRPTDKYETRRNLLVEDWRSWHMKSRMDREVWGKWGVRPGGVGPDGSHSSVETCSGGRVPS